MHAVLSSIRYKDRILVIENGQILESGTQAELIAKKDHYHYRVGYGG